VGGCISTGKTREEVERNIREALELHFEALRADSVPIPAPGTWSAVVEISVDVSPARIEDERGADTDAR
jgi:predicted RNase H-like HicB family nuclease